MKKVFTLLTLALLSIGTAWADPTPGEANSTYLDISNYATIATAGGLTTNKNASTLYLYDTKTDWLTMSAYIAQQATSKQTWISRNGSSTGDESWSGSAPFSGSTAYFTSGGTNAVVNSSNTLSFRVTKCSEVRAIVKVRGNSRYVHMEIYEVNASGTRQGDAVQKKSSSTKSSTVISSDALDGTKIYEVYFYGSSSNNEFVQEVAFKLADTRTATSLTYSAASASVNLGDAFDAPTLTKSPAALEGVTYTSSNRAVATIDANGAVTIVAGGITTITASFAGNETYKPSSASYVLTVTDTSKPSYTNETFKATWAFSTGAAGQTAGYTYGTATEELMKNNSVSLGSNLSYGGTQALTESGSSIGENSTKITQNAAGSATETKNAIKFTITPKLGITFTPTKVKFRATRCGTDGGAMAMSWIDSEHSAVELGTASAAKTNTDPARDNNATKNYTVYEYDLTAKGAVATTGECGLQIITHSANGKSYAFSQIEIEGKLNGALSAVMTYTINASAGAGGSVTPTSTIVNEGDDLSIEATADTGYKFLNWTKASDGEWSSTTNPLALSNISADETYTANFKQLKSITFAKGEGTGEVPALEYADEGEQYTVPKSYFLKKDGYTLTGWSDGVNTYVAGDKITIASSNITLTAVFTANTQSLDARSNDVTVTWDFQKKNIGLFTPLSGYFVAKANVNGENIDIPMAFDKSIPNANWTDWANTGNKPTLTIPAAKGMQITLLTYSSPSTSTIAGANTYTVTGNNNPYTVTYTYEGSANTIDIYLEDAGYIRTLTVVYPANVAFTTIGETGYATLYTTKALNFAAATPAGLIASTITLNGEKTEATPTAVSDVPANTGVMLQGTTGTTYMIPVIASSETAKGDLTGSADATAADGTQYVLAKPNEKELGFYKATSGSIAAGKAFLSIPQNAPEFILFNLGSETTDINAVKGAEPKVNGQVFDLQGRKVAQPTKGLYIVNGKKMVIK